MNILKSIGAIAAGIILIVAFSLLTDRILVRTGVFPESQSTYSTDRLVLALLYRCVYAFMGGLITVILAPDRPIRHVIILGLIGTFANLIGVFVGWSSSAHWYPIALVFTALPFTWLGGKLGEKR